MESENSGFLKSDDKETENSVFSFRNSVFSCFINSIFVVEKFGKKLIFNIDFHLFSILEHFYQEYKPISSVQP